MKGSWSDDEFVYFRDKEIEMLQDIRGYKRDQGHWPSRNEFDEWTGSGIKPIEITESLRGWRKAVQAAGGEPNNDGRLEIYDHEDVKFVIGELAEKSLEYEFGGVKRKSPEGEAVPITHWSELDDQIEMDIPSRRTFSVKIEESYPTLVESMGYTHPTSDSEAAYQEKYDWDEVKNRLKEDIQGVVEWRMNKWDKGEIPSFEYFDKKSEYPSDTQLVTILGPKREWKDELEISIDRKAKDVDVDLNKFNL